MWKLYQSHLLSPQSVTTKTRRFFSQQNRDSIGEEITHILKHNNWSSLLDSSDLPNKLNPNVVRTFLRRNQVGDSKRLLNFFYWGIVLWVCDSLKPVVLVGPFQDNFFASFLLGWSVTTVSGVCAYPFDTLRRRLMLTSGQPLKYRNAMHVFHEIIWLEGFSALFRGVTANMLLGVAGAGVLAGYDQLCRIAYKHGHSTGPHPVLK